MKARDAVTWGRQRLAARGVPEPIADAEILLAFVLKTERGRLVIERDRILSPSQRARYQSLIEQRARRIPLPYLTGEVEFYSLPLKVTSAVLIPRPETEILVEAVLERLKHRSGELRGADLATGSGCVAVVLAAHVPHLRLYATDVSLEALMVARANVRRYGMGRRVRLRVGDLFTALPKAACGRLDFIAANLPYVAKHEFAQLAPEIRRYEPRQALDGGRDGLVHFRRLLPEAPLWLRPEGLLALEVGFGQAPKVAAMAWAAGLSAIEVVKDYAGIERVVIGGR